MDVTVIKGDCIHHVHSEEQLNTFLSYGWSVMETEAPAEPKVKKTIKKK